MAFALQKRCSTAELSRQWVDCSGRQEWAPGGASFRTGISDGRAVHALPRLLFDDRQGPVGQIQGQPQLLLLGCQGCLGAVAAAGGPFEHDEHVRPRMLKAHQLSALLPVAVEKRLQLGAGILGLGLGLGRRIVVVPREFLP